MSNDFTHELAMKDIDLNLMARYTPQPDGISETLNRIIDNDVKATKRLTGCQKSFRIPAIEMTVNSQYCTTSKKIEAAPASMDDTVILHKLWYSQKPDYPHLWV